MALDIAPDQADAIPTDPDEIRSALGVARTQLARLDDPWHRPESISEQRRDRIERRRLVECVARLEAARDIADEAAAVASRGAARSVDLPRAIEAYEPARTALEAANGRLARAGRDLLIALTEREELVEAETIAARLVRTAVARADIGDSRGPAQLPAAIDEAGRVTVWMTRPSRIGGLAGLPALGHVLARATLARGRGRLSIEGVQTLLSYDEEDPNNG